MSLSDKRKQYKFNEKADVIRLATDSNKSLSEVERETGVSRKTIRAWINNSPKKLNFLNYLLFRYLLLLNCLYVVYYQIFLNIRNT